jgi:hypothetical protein
VHLKALKVCQEVPDSNMLEESSSQGLSLPQLMT